MASWYAVWCKHGGWPGGWMTDSGTGGVIAFPTKRYAMNAAAKHYGFRTYAEAKKADWCEVWPLGVAKGRPESD